MTGCRMSEWVDSHFIMYVRNWRTCWRKKQPGSRWESHCLWISMLWVLATAYEYRMVAHLFGVSRCSVLLHTWLSTYNKSFGKNHFLKLLKNSWKSVFELLLRRLRERTLFEGLLQMMTELYTDSLLWNLWNKSAPKTLIQNSRTFCDCKRFFLCQYVQAKNKENYTTILVSS